MFRFLKEPINETKNGVEGHETIHTNSSSTVPTDRKIITKRTTSMTSLTTISVTNITDLDCSEYTVCSNQQDAYLNSPACTPVGFEVFPTNTMDSDVTTPFELARAQASSIGQWGSQRKRRQNYNSNQRKYNTDDGQEDDPFRRSINNFFKSYFELSLFVCHSCKSTPFVFSEDFAYDDRDDRDDLEGLSTRNASIFENDDSLRDSFADEDINTSIHDELDLISQEPNPESKHEYWFPTDVVQYVNEISHSSKASDPEDLSVIQDMMTLKRGLAFDLEDYFVDEQRDEQRDERRDEQRDDKCILEMIDGEVRETRYSILQQSKASNLLEEKQNTLTSPAA